MDRKKVTLAVGILSANLMVMSTSAVGSAIAAIAKSFPSEPVSKVQMMSTIPQFGQVIATLLFAWLTYHMSRKSIGVLALACAGVGGFLPAVLNSNLNVMLGCMLVLGFGIGLIANVGPVLVQEHFDGEERATVMGWQVGFNNVGMMAFTAIGGVLGANNWSHLFWIFLFSFVIMLFFIAMVPNDAKVQRVDNGGQRSGSGLKGINGYVWMILMVTLVMSLIMTAFMSNESIVLAAKGHGTSYTAMVTAIGNIGGIITAAFLSYIRKLTRHDTMAWGFVAFCLSFVLIIFTNNVFCHVLGNIFSGVGIVMINATVPFSLSILADKTQFPVVISINTFVSAIAGGLAPVILAACHLNAGMSQYVFGAVASIIVAVLMLIFRTGTRISKASEDSTSNEGVQAAPANK